jgi:hypothetical protein
MPPPVERITASRLAARAAERPTEPSFSRARRLALPVVLIGLLLLAYTPVRMALALFFAMWLHELGHAATAWLCGSVAMPLPWVTYGGEERSFFFIALEFAGLAAWGFFRRDHRPIVAVLGVLLLLGVLVPARTMRMLVVFGGDGGAMVLGTLLMLTVFLPDHWRLSKGGLRWGFLVIGAGAFAGVFQPWLAAWRDPDEIPFGHIEGVGLSDPSKLVDQFGWSEPQLVHRYLALGFTCLAVLLVAQVLAARASARSRG